MFFLEFGRCAHTVIRLHLSRFARTTSVKICIIYIRTGVGVNPLKCGQSDLSAGEAFCGRKNFSE